MGVAGSSPALPRKLLLNVENVIGRCRSPWVCLQPRQRQDSGESHLKEEVQVNNLIILNNLIVMYLIILFGTGM